MKYNEGGPSNLNFEMFPGEQIHRFEGIDAVKSIVESVYWDDGQITAVPMQCEPSLRSKKHKILSQEIDKETATKPISMDMLNDDTLLAVFSYLPIMDLMKFEQVSKRWMQVIDMSYRRFKKINIEKDISKTFNGQNLEFVLKRIGTYLIYLELPLFHDDISSKYMFSIVNRYCKNLEHLKVRISIEKACDLNALSKHIAGNLRSFQVINHGKICDSAISLILKKTTKLEEFSLTARRLKGSSLMKLPETCTTLSINCGYHVKNEFFQKGLAKLPNLKKLAISFNDYIKPSALQTVSNRLVSLDIKGATHFFMLDWSSYVENGLFETLSFQNLKKLAVSGCWITNKIVKTITEICPLLEDLDLSNTGDFHDPAVFYFLGNLKHLVRLNVSGTKINLTVLLHLAVISNTFQKLLCFNCENLSQGGFRLLIDRCPELEYLGIGPAVNFGREFFRSVLKSVEERPNRMSLVIDINSGNSQYSPEQEGERLNLTKGPDVGNNLKIKFSQGEVMEDTDRFWYVKSHNE